MEFEGRRRGFERVSGVKGACGGKSDGKRELGEEGQVLRVTGVKLGCRGKVGGK